MDEEKLLGTIIGYMKNWLMIRCDDDRITVLPSAGRAAGYYPDDFKGGIEE